MEISTEIVLSLQHLKAISYYVNLTIAIYSIDYGKSCWYDEYDFFLWK